MPSQRPRLPKTNLADRTMAEVEVYLESAEKRVFACAYAWPGWVRSGKTEEAALAALVAYAPWYAPVPRVAGLDFSLRTALKPRGSKSLRATQPPRSGHPRRFPPQILTSLPRRSESVSCRFCLPAGPFLTMSSPPQDRDRLGGRQRRPATAGL